MDPDANLAMSRPILFGAPMLRAIIAGEKTVTRRLVRPTVGGQRRWLTPALLARSPWAVMCKGGAQMEHPKGGPLAWIRCPYGDAGDRLWVRETWQTHTAPLDRDRAQVIYRADGEVHHEGDPMTWRSAMYMPRWASRITLEVVSVGCERLHAITDEDARREGVVDRTAFAVLWDEINAARATWASNPWVWRVAFDGGAQ